MPISPFPGTSPVAGIPLSVYFRGTHAFATIYADAVLTPLENPFTVDETTGEYLFYADDAVALDLTLSTGAVLPIGA